MRWSWVVALPGLVVLVGCPPPPAISVDTESGGLPVITLVYPPEDTTQLALAEDGYLHFTAVVEFDNFDFEPPNPSAGPVQGQGHWHLFVEPAPAHPAYIAVGELYEDAVITGADPDGDGVYESLPTGTYNIRAQIQNNDHTDYTFPCGRCQDALEVQIVPFGTLDTDG